jgi:hypothetical protein
MYETARLDFVEVLSLWVEVRVWCWPEWEGLAWMRQVSMGAEAARKLAELEQQALSLERQVRGLAGI